MMKSTESPTLDFETRARLEKHLDAVEDVLRRYQQSRSTRNAIVDELENQIRENLAEKCDGRDATLDDLNALLDQMDPPEAYARNSIDIPAPIASDTPFQEQEASPSRLNRCVLFGLICLPLGILTFMMATVGLDFVSTSELVRTTEWGEVIPPGAYSGTYMESVVRTTPTWAKALMVVMAPGFLAPFIATILGWVGVSQIRHSQNREYGLGLAYALGIGGIVLILLSLALLA